MNWMSSDNGNFIKINWIGLFKSFTLHSTRIIKHRRVIKGIVVRAHTRIFSLHRIYSRPSAQPGNIIARTMIVQAAFLISFFAGIAVTLGHGINAGINRLVRCGAIRMILPIYFLFFILELANLRGLDFLVTNDSCIFI